jgi:2,3-bisphosphoglycerate-independent phosphoglycerate mutase
VIPIVLVILDGLGDRPLPELDDRTPAEAARTPNLDRLARAGASGIHLPFGWGRAASSEVAHWALLGYGDRPFCGRAVLEALGHGRAVPYGRPTFYAALRPAGAHGLGPYAGAADAYDAADLFDAIDGVEFDHLRRAEAILTGAPLTSAAVTDTEPLHPGQPALSPRPLADADNAADATAVALAALIAEAEKVLTTHPVNARRSQPLTVLTTKWAGVRAPLPTFAELTGLRGAAITTSALYRGLAAVMGLDQRDATDLHADLATAAELTAGGAEFVHVHTKAPDEAGHTKDPYAKRDVLETLDAQLERVHGLTRTAVVCVTGDHATPSSGGLMHSGDPTPLVVAGPNVRPDGVERFGEQYATGGSYGTLNAADILPLLAGHADRARLLGHRPAPHPTLAQPRP